MFMKNLFKKREKDPTNGDFSEFKYLYDTHLHTSEGSSCAHQNGEAMAKACKEFGYAGIFVTEHSLYKNNDVYRPLPWQEKVYIASQGYDHAKEWGNKNGLAVWFGIEHEVAGAHYLIYGLSPDMLSGWTELNNTNVTEMCEIVHANGGVVGVAHPYRDKTLVRDIIGSIDHVDAVEGINSKHSHPLHQSRGSARWNDQAIELANEHNKPITAGSDSHSISIVGGGILTKKPIETEHDYISLLKGKEMYLLTDGEKVWDRHGNFLFNGTGGFEK